MNFFAASTLLLASLGLSAFCPAATAAEQDKAAFTTKPEYRGLFGKLQSADFVVEGATNPKSIVYVFVDPNCPYCHHVWMALQYYEKVGLQARWLPVGVIKPSSLGRAAAILEAADPAAALRTNETGYRPIDVEGGIPALANPKPATVAKLEANLALMRAFGLRGVPGMVWQDAGGTVYVRPGVPRMQELPRITGLPEQWIDDPQLDEYR